MKTIPELKKTGRLCIQMEGGDGCRGFIQMPEESASMVFIASWGCGWDHVSLSYRNRCPRWEEMQKAKEMFFEPEECVVQYHPPQSEYINNHPYCLHLWRPQDANLLLPPTWMVGPKPGQSVSEVRREANAAMDAWEKEERKHGTSRHEVGV